MKLWEISSIWMYIGELWLGALVLLLLCIAVLPDSIRNSKYMQQWELEKWSILGIVIGIWLEWGSRIGNHSWGNNLKIITLLGLLGIILQWQKYHTLEKIDRGWGLMLMLTGTLGLMFLISSEDLLSLYLSMELQALSFYTLAAWRRDDEKSGEGGVKYFILGGMSSGIYLYGVSLIYGWSGLISVEELKIYFYGNGMEKGLEIGIMLVLIGLIFKIGGVPFHWWLPDVYTGSPTIITGYFAIVPKIGVLSAISMILWGVLGNEETNISKLLLGVSVLSIIVGTLGGLNQSIMKRLLAYSSIANIGYIMVGFLDIKVMWLYMIIYMITSIMMFTIILGVYKKLDRRPMKYIIEWYGWGRQERIVVISMSLGLLSLGGIPPLGGFLGKWMLFTTAVKEELYLWAWIGIIGSIIGIVYYLRIITKMYFFDTKSSILENILNPVMKIDRVKSLILGTTLYLILIILWNPLPLLLICEEIRL